MALGLHARRDNPDKRHARRPGLGRDVPPGKEDLELVANSVTLICGQRDAVLVDTFLTSEQAKTLGSGARCLPGRSPIA